MTKNSLIKNSCKNCRYFSQYYSKQGASFKIVYSGHCKNDNNKKFRERAPHNSCELWEDISVQDAAQDRSIRETLQFIANTLGELNAMLKCDDNY